MAGLFSKDLDIARLLTGLRIEAGCSIEPGNTLIILDEIQESPRALTSLKYFAENAPEYFVVAAGSLLGLAMHRGISFPVGKVDFLNLYPLSFHEFLLALGEPELALLLVSQEWELLEIFREKLTEHLRTYFCLGGMPEIVQSFMATRDLNHARGLQKKLLMSYEQDFSKYAEPQLVPRIRAVWKSIPVQLAREQRKFVYGLVREGARAREYELAIEWLCDAGLLHKRFRVSKPGMPLKAYQEPNAFKLFMLDVGLLAAHAGIPLQSLLQGNEFFEEFKGALTEQYASQELCLQDELTVSYWSSESSQAEVDFLLQDDSAVFPLEIKASENLQAKSLKSYRDKYSPLRSFRSSLSSYREESWLTNIPLYALSRLTGEMKKWTARHPPQ
jgi:predicted AAA+ superfamily ATPase